MAKLVRKLDNNNPVDIYKNTVGGTETNIYTVGIDIGTSEYKISGSALGTADKLVISESGEITIKGGVIKVGTGSADGTVKSNGDNNLVLQTGNTVTGNITINDGTNGDIQVSPNGTGNFTINSTVSASGVVTISDDTEATTTATGALVVSGGIGIDKDCYIGGTLFATASTTTSDQRFKENVITIDNPIDKVNGLRGVYFDWIDKKRFNDRKQIGFIAQEVEAVCPELVIDNGNYKTVNYSQSVGLLVEAIKEQQKMIQLLRKEVELLKTKLN